jgi:hypothetical protein
LAALLDGRVLTAAQFQEISVSIDNSKEGRIAGFASYIE